MKSIKRWGIAAVAVLALGGGASAIAASSGSTAKPNKLTGYPAKINRLDLAGYVIQTSYPLGKLDKGNTYKQVYTAHGVTASATAGPYAGGAAVHFKYIAMPIAHDMFMVVWLEPHQGHNVFLFNMKTHIVSVVTYAQQGYPSLGAFTIMKRGHHRLP